jgi:hypothetical protein
MRDGVITFADAIGVRSQNNGQAGAIYAPQQLGDTAPTGYFGGIVSGYSQVGLRAASDSNAGIYGESNSGPGVQAVSRGDNGLQVIRDNGDPDSIVSAMVIERQLDAPAEDGVGLLLELQAPANNAGVNVNGRILAQLRAQFNVVDYATRSTIIQHYAGDAGVAGAGTVRETFSEGADGTHAVFGLYDHDPVAQQTIAAAATNGTDVITLANSIRTILLNLGAAKP